MGLEDVLELFRVMRFLEQAGQPLAGDGNRQSD